MTRRSARLVELGARALGFRLGGGDVGLRLEDLPLHGHHLGGTNGRVDEIRLRCRERAARGFDLTPLRRNDGRLRFFVSLGSLRLLLGDQLLLKQARHGLPVPLRLRVRGLGLRKLSVRRGKLALRLIHAALGITARLPDTEPTLLQLLVEHGDLMLGQPHPRLGLTNRGHRLLLARANLLVVEDRDHLPRLDAIAFPHGDLADPPRRLRGDGGVVALDASAHREHARRQRGRREHEAPDGEPAETEDDHHRGDREPTPSRAHPSFWGPRNGPQTPSARTRPGGAVARLGVVTRCLIAAVSRASSRRPART